MNTVLSLIIMLSQNTLKNDLTVIISQYIIKHLSTVQTITIKQMSEDCYTSTTSIIKYYEMLGFNSYTQFKNNLLSGIKTRQLQLIDKHQNHEIEEIKQLIEIIQSLSMESLNKESFLQSIDQCVDYIHMYKSVHFYGATFPLCLTSSYCEDMAIMGVSSFVHQLNYGYDNLHQNEGISIIITLTGRFMKHHKNIYHELCKNSQKVILISQQEGDHQLLMNIQVPRTLNYDYNELILLMILDLIKVKYYQKYYSVA